MGQNRDENLLKQLGKRIVYLRDFKGISQTDLSKKAHMGKNYICDIENGKRNTSITNLKRIADALGYTLSDLLKDLDKF